MFFFLSREIADSVRMWRADKESASDVENCWESVAREGDRAGSVEILDTGDEGERCARGFCGTLCTHACVHARVRIPARERTKLCARVGPVRCYFTGSNCRRKHSKHRQAVPGSPARSVRYTVSRIPHLFPILFYPRAPPRMSNRHVRPSAVTTDRLEDIETESCTWCAAGLNSK